MILKFCFLIFFVLNFISCKASDCQDEADWCSSFVNYCSVNSIRSSCRKTCGRCPKNSPTCASMSCSQLCNDSPVGGSASCACEPGFTLQSDGRTCADVDECSLNPNICRNAANGNQNCVNNDGSYLCTMCTIGSGGLQWPYYQRNEFCTRNIQSNCGRSSSIGVGGGRIVGGRDALIRRWPWMVHITTTTLCGGSLITSRFILTAAHCFTRNFNYAKPKHLITIRLGVQNTTADNNVHAQTVNAQRVHPHPNYNYPNHDIALIELESDVILSDYVYPVCLGDGEEPSVGEKCYATGYGRLYSRGPLAAVLQEVDLPIVENNICVSAYRQTNMTVIPDIHICAGYTQGGKDSCQGDSGGPLVCQRCSSCDWYVSGVTSFGEGCARAGFYGVYTRIERYSLWINGITRRPATSYGPCNNLPQPIGLGNWSPWSSCSVPCGSGTQTRTRSCRDGTNNCAGNKLQAETCNNQPCGTWTTWSSWSICSASCGRGQQTSTRSCDGGSPGQGGCLGSATRSQSCQIRPCQDPCANKVDLNNLCSIYKSYCNSNLNFIRVNCRKTCCIAGASWATSSK